MTREQWERLKTVFMAAVDQPAEQRRGWLARACEGDERLLREAEALLEAHETAGDFLQTPVMVDAGTLADAPAVEEPALAPGTEIATYRILSEIARGGMGVVYLAEDLRLGRQVALKSLPSAVASNPELRERLRREARAAATISHPAVAVVYALEEIGNHIIIVSEYVRGRTLRSEIEKGPLEPGRVRRLAIEMARALCAAHEAGVTHRDLKPENVLLTTDDGVKVVDFGIAQIEGGAGSRLTRAGALLGTPAYMAPEQLLAQSTDARVDIYAFGMILSEMLTGRHPMMAAAPQTDTVPPAFGPIVSRCLQVAASARYQSARALLQALEEIDSEHAASAAVATRDQRSARWWWEFHQIAAAVAYSLTMIPVWRTRGLLGVVPGRVFFVIVLAAVIVASGLRLHLWFTSRFYPSELAWVRRRAGRWVQAADWVFASALVAAGLVMNDERSALTVVLLAIGIGSAVAFLIIEPVTARAAFHPAE